MPAVPHASDVTVGEVLTLLDGTFSGMAEAVAEDRYAFWLGSGISLGRIAGLKQLIRRALDHLQSKVEAGDAACRYRKAIGEVLRVAGLSTVERDAIDPERPTAEWPNLLGIIERLAGNYARFLEIAVDGEPDDYILWAGVDFCGVYADPDMEPDAEHLCMAVLILEGLASKIASANWDDLIEKAVAELSPGVPALVVCVTSRDLREPHLQGHLYKFHGCAVRARDDEVNYRNRIVARISQINAWRDAAENAALVARLVDLAVTSPTLMIGLSAQDSNIQTVFTQAENRMEWPWPSDPPAYVFSEDGLGVDQKALLKNVYHAVYTAANRDAIYQSALVRAFAKPLLAATVLHALCAKLCRLIEIAPGGLGADDRSAIQEGLRHLRNNLASQPGAESVVFVRKAIRHASRLMALYHAGDATAPALPYRPITSKPIQGIAAKDPAVGTSGLREFAVGLGLLGIGHRDGHWQLEPPEPAGGAEAGALRLARPGGALKLVFASNAHAAINLITNGHLGADDDAIIVHSLQVTPAMRRSPYARRGRRGRPGQRDVSLAALLGEAASAENLFDGFRQALAI